MGMALDEPKEEDKIKIINEIQVAIEPLVEEEIDDLVVEYDKSTNSFVLSGHDDCE